MLKFNVLRTTGYGSLILVVRITWQGIKVGSLYYMKASEILFDWETTRPCLYLEKDVSGLKWRESLKLQGLLKAIWFMFWKMEWNISFYSYISVIILSTKNRENLVWIENQSSVSSLLQANKEREKGKELLRK